MNTIEEILIYFPSEIRSEIGKFRNEFANLEEVRLRVGRSIILKFNQQEKVLSYSVTTKEILEILQRICENSIYTYQNQICNGFITIKGGHRVGITGNVVVQNGQVINISHIYSLNFRIAKQIIGCSNTIMKYILNTRQNLIHNTLIISPPGRGKTTLLRDIIRNISNGITDISFRGLNVGLVDERGEIAAMYKGVPQNDMGERTDILDNISKSLGMKMLVRSMSPNVISADEIGTKEDVEAINYAVTSGVKGLFTAHGSSIDDIVSNPILNKLYELKIIERILLIEENRSVKLVYVK